jgi:cholesterol transport system auxiliary component
MNRPSPLVTRRAFASALTLGLSGCSLFSGPPPNLYRLTPKSTFPPDLPRVSGQLLVDLPFAPAGLDTARIALSRSPVSVDYFAQSEWTDRLPLLIQTALLESFENSHTITAIDRESAGLRADYILKSEFRHFEAVYTSENGAPTIWVAAHVRLVKMPERGIIAQGAFERRRSAAANDLSRIVLAFDEALGGVMKDIVVWVVTNPALSRGHR